jgi:hypothetical protein
LAQGNRHAHFEQYVWVERPIIDGAKIEEKNVGFRNSMKQVRQ